jgi:hypothetical protein
MGALPSALAMIAEPSDRRADRKAFAGSRAKDACDAKKTDPDTSKTPHRTPPGSLEIAKDTPPDPRYPRSTVIRGRPKFPPAPMASATLKRKPLRAAKVVSPRSTVIRDPTEIPAGADGERDLAPNRHPVPLPPCHWVP